MLAPDGWTHTQTLMPWSRRKVLLVGALGAVSASTVAASAGSSAARIRGEDAVNLPTRPGGPGLLFGPGPAGRWDSERVSCPRVLREADGSWRMWYYGRDPAFDRRITLPTGRVGLARSSDGLHWERVDGPATLGAVFDPHPDPARFDSSHVGISDIWQADGLYWMAYFGGDPSLQKIGPMEIKGFPMASGLAISRDGVHWLRVEGPHRGAMVTAGAAGEFDEIMAAWPQVLRLEDGSWRMYYHGLDRRQHYTMGWAESADGLRWNKRGPLLGPGPAGRFDDVGVATRHILRMGGEWVMFYEGCKRRADSPIEVIRQLGVATSRDGLDWQRVDGPESDGAMLAQAPLGSGRWDHQLGCPWVVVMPDRSLRMYYIGSNERRGGSELDTVNQIGVAVSDGDRLRWRRHVES